MAGCVITLPRVEGAGFLVRRLAEAGIHAWPSYGHGSTHDIYVEGAPDPETAQPALMSFRCV